MTITVSNTIKTNPISAWNIEPEGLNIKFILDACGFVKNTDWTGADECSEVDWINEDGVAWIGGASKPTWAQMMAAFQLIRDLRYPDKPPAGDKKISATSYDHGKWMKCDNRLLTRTDFPLLFNKIGTTFNIGGETGLQFRAPTSAAGKMLMVTGGGHSYGATGGSESATLTVSHIPEHDHDLNDSILKSTGTTPALGLLGSTQQLALIGSSEKTGKYGAASPTAVPTLSPYVSSGNLFVNIGHDYFE